MPGFFVSNTNIMPKLNNVYPKRCIERACEVDEYTCAQNTLNKFMDDKIFESKDKYVLILEGVILNKHALMEQYSLSNWRDTMQAMIVQDDETFFKNLEGPFSGAVYNKDKQEWKFFTNQTGETPLFYYYNSESGRITVASQVNYIIENLPHDVTLHLDHRAAVDMLTFAYMEGDETYAKEIKRIRGGQYLCVKHGLCELKQYHSFKKDKYDLSGMSNMEIIEILDRKFRTAVKLEFDKDNEYGYEHLVDLSGGLDSRMTSWVAHSLGFVKQQNITYCQANSDDEMIAKEISAELHHELLVKPLDDISFMYDADEIIKMNYGLSIYCGITGGNRLLKSLNMDRYGIEHTGMLGDVIIGSFFKDYSQLSKQNPSGMYSTKLSKDVDNAYCKTFPDQELYLLCVRGINGACATHMIRTNYTATWSPFLNTDFFEFCLSIPLELRCEHRIYIQWILAKYPEAAKFKWEKTGLRITASKAHSVIHKIVKKGPAKMAKICGISMQRNVGMNPAEYWYVNNKKLRDYFEEIFLSMKDEGILYGDLKKDINELYSNGNCMEKAQVVTLLISIRNYFNGMDNNVFEKDTR